MTPRQLRVRELNTGACRALLARNSIGRLAFSFQDRVDIRPLSYVFDDEWIFGRTSPGEKLLTVRHHRWVAFQVDEIEDELNWSSVVAHGPFQILDEGESAQHRELLAQARRAIREENPGAFSPTDPTPERSFIFGVAVQEYRGRAARFVTLEE